MKAIILAAGFSRRMKAQKLLLPFGGRTVLGAVVYNVLDAGFDEVVLVTSTETSGRCGVRDARLREALNTAPERGQSSSLALGLSETGEVDFCVTLADLPLVTAGEYARYRDLFLVRGERFTAMVPCRGGRFGHPSFFAPVWRERLAGVTGDKGGRDVLGRYR